MKIKRTISLIAILIAISTQAAILEPVKWAFDINMTSETEGEFKATASVESGWHLYGLNLPEGGPRSTDVKFENLTGVELIGQLTPDTPAENGVDEVFNLKLSWWNSAVTLIQKFKLLSGSKNCRFEGYVTYQACNSKTCISPAKTPFDVAAGKPGIIADSTSSANADSSIISASTPNLSNSDGENSLWTPVSFDTVNNENISRISDSPLLHIFFWGFLGGLVALLTPCVWPMIPMTVSFFLKKDKKKSQSIRDAFLYGVSIVVIYLTLGLAITLFFGASKLNELSTSALFNLAFFALLLVFAISFFGAFEIRLPAKWSNLADGKAETTTGLISIFFMAFTLSLVSFSCTGPIIGTLLVEAASNGDIAGPAVGMGSFAMALAIPFAIFALFPSWLKGMPKSGGWLNTVKVVLGFLELALSLKFLSVADMAYGWRILDREIFICLWIIIFVLLGMYLLGKLHFAHDSEVSTTSLTRFFLALASWSFALYLLPGLWGAPLKGVSAFIPPLETQDFNLYQQAAFEEYDDFNVGMEAAIRQHKPVLIDFSGYGCVNCRKMEGAVFDTPEVRAIIEHDFVLIKLMVDDKTSLPQPETVVENGKTIKLKTIGDKWSYLQRSKFGANVQPYYVILNDEGQPLSTPYYYDENVNQFIEWLSSAKNKYNSTSIQQQQ